MLFRKWIRIRTDNWSSEPWAEIFLTKCNKETEPHKWKRSRTLESSLYVPVCWVTNRPLGLRSALTTPRRLHTILFFSLSLCRLSTHTNSIWWLYFAVSPSFLLPAASVHPYFSAGFNRAAQSSSLSYCQPLINILKWSSIFKNELALTFSLWIKASSFLTLRRFYTDR